MSVRIPSQRATIAGQSGRIEVPWWQFLSGVANAINASRFSSSATVSPVTGTVSETVAGTIPVLIGKTGSVRLSMAFSCTNNANAKTAIIKLGSSTVQTYVIDPSTNTQTAQIFIVGRSGGDQYTTTLPSVNCTGSGGVATTEDLSVGINITISFQLANAADSISLESWLIEVEQS